jgi:hypothetical protein
MCKQGVGDRAHTAQQKLQPAFLPLMPGPAVDLGGRHRADPTTSGGGIPILGKRQTYPLTSCRSFCKAKSKVNIDVIKERM